ncbi:MAG: glycosyltransferase family 4 protein [bacterium]
MKIAQVAPLYESVPPRCYGGTERVVSYLTEELIRQGHEVTLFASGDSQSKARLITCSPCALRLKKAYVDHIAYHILMIDKVFKFVKNFDVIHSHIDYIPFPLARRGPIPFLTTLHGRLDLPELIEIYNEFREMAIVSISNAQRRPVPFIDWQETVYHGLPVDLYKVYEGEGKYLAFLGRISPEKGVDLAIKIAKKVEMPLKIAAKIDKTDEKYFEYVIKPLLNSNLIEFIGEVNEREKNEFLGNAYCLLFPIDWPEPFGLVIIEAMACGTPVIARCCGSVPEIMVDGVTGYIFETEEEAVEQIKKVSAIDRKRCRDVFEKRFTVEMMTNKYINIYKKLINGHLSKIIL